VVSPKRRPSLHRTVVPRTIPKRSEEEAMAEAPEHSRPSALRSAARDGQARKLDMTIEELEQTRAAWDRIAPGYDRTNTPTQMWLGNEGLRRAGLLPGMRFADVAAGSGALSIPAARIGARALATDLSPVMLELLQERARKEGLEIETQVMDGHDLALDDDSFDMAGSQFGVMLFPDMPKGISEMARVVRPGGRVLMNVYGDPHKIEFFGFFIRAIQSVRPNFTGPPTDPPPLPFQLQSPDRLRKELATAGLKDIRVETITETTVFETGKALWEWLVWSNPIAEIVLGSLDLTIEERDVIQHELDEMVKERARGTSAARLTNPINIGIGTK
jgi:ubiquinone/menaquinone biosynthesis C-methylase UbiE